jgi:AraC family transcriptional regulator
LTAIAIETGFGSVANFSRCFRKALGLSPSRANLQKIDTSAWVTASAIPILLAARTPTPIRLQHRGAFLYAYKRVTGGYLKPDELVAAYHAIEQWADAHGTPRTDSQLIGMSQDDPQIVPAAKCRYDFCRTLSGAKTARSADRKLGISFAQMPAAEWAMATCQGDMAAVSNAWEYLFRDWLPASGFQPAAIPAMEIFLKRPEEIGWDRFDLQCCLAVEPL